MAQRKGIGGRRRKRYGTRRRLKTIEAAPPEWTEVPLGELEPRLWGDDARPDTPAGQEAASRTRGRDAGPAPTHPPAALQELEERIAQHLQGRMDELAAERRVMLQGVRDALVLLGEGLNRRIDEVINDSSERGGAAGAVDEVAKLGQAITDRLTEVREELLEAVHGAEQREAQTPSARRMDQLAEAVHAYGRRLDEVVMSLEAFRARMAAGGERRRLEQLTSSVDSLRAEVRDALGGKADLEDVRAMVTAQRRREKATADLRKRIDELGKALEAFGRPRAAPRLAVDMQMLERRVRAVEQALPRKLSGALDRRIAPLEEQLEQALEQVRADLEPLREMARELQARRDRS